MMCLYQQLYIAQPQTNAGQRTVGKITAPIELIEYTVLFGNRNADAIIRHPYRQLVILQKAIYNNMHRLARILTAFSIKLLIILETCTGSAVTRVSELKWVSIATSLPSGTW